MNAIQILYSGYVKINSDDLLDFYNISFVLFFRYNWLAQIPILCVVIKQNESDSDMLLVSD